ncbi:MAG: tRNA-dihydrouridine synthase [Acutalibacteraceae bacterium]
MAGVSDKSFRELCTSFGAAYVISEMVSSKGLQYSDRKSKELMELFTRASCSNSNFWRST